jgi:hypothetical protein
MEDQYVNPLKKTINEIIEAALNRIINVVLPTLLDKLTISFKTVAYEHHEIHSGSSFTCHYENMVTNTGERSIIAFNTPNTSKEIHITVQVFCTSITRFQIIRNPRITNGTGTELAIFNRNQKSSKESGVSSIDSEPKANRATRYDETQSAACGIDTTEELDSVVIGAPSNIPARSGIGGLNRGSLEWLLAPGEQYAFVAHALDDSDNYHTIELSWYEHKSKN